MSKNREVRFYPISLLRASGDGRKITGYAAVFNQLSEDLGGFREKVLPGAFDRCLRGSPDVRCLFNHNADVVLGRTKSGTLQLKADGDGLRFDCDLPDTQAARDVRESIRRGDVDQCSFAFVVQGENWRDGTDAAGNPHSIRELTDVDLFDVSPVTYPAYPQTNVSARLLWPEGEPAEVRQHKKAAVVSRSVTVAPAPAKPRAISDSECDQLLSHVNEKLGVRVSKSQVSEEERMREKRVLAATEKSELRRFLVTGKHDQRDLTTGGPAAAFIPEQFNSLVYGALKAYDALFDPEVCTVFESNTGGPLDLFAVDDTASEASILEETFADSELDPTTGRIQLPQAPAWDTGVVKVTWALLQDSGVDIEGMLAKAFAVRFARGIGPSLIGALLDGAKLGATANGSATNTGGSEGGSTSIGTADLVALRTSINPAYRAAGAWWLMNDDTLSFLDSLLDKAGRPVLPQIYVGGQRMLMGHPVGICPSLENIGPGAIPIMFGATSYFVLRTVKGEGRLVRMAERYAEYLQTGFKSFMRANAALLCAAGADSPVKYLQCATS